MRFGVIALWVSLLVFIGWFVLLAARPRITRNALAAAAATGLIATLFAFSMLAPLFEMNSNQELQLHPIQDPTSFAITRGKVEIFSTADAAYIDANYPVNQRPEVLPGHRWSTFDLYQGALLTNRYYNGLTVGWMLLLVLLLIFIGLSVQSTWAADYLLRSRPNRLARVWCYFELYPLSGTFEFLSLVAILMTARKIWFHLEVRTMWIEILLMFATSIGVVAVAQIGVIRRWHPAIRIASYVSVFGLWFFFWSQLWI